MFALASTLVSVYNSWRASWITDDPVPRHSHMVGSQGSLVVDLNQVSGDGPVIEYGLPTWGLYGPIAERPSQPQVLKNVADALGVFDAGNDLQHAAALLATLNLDAKHPFQTLRPSHRDVLEVR